MAIILEEIYEVALHRYNMKLVAGGRGLRNRPLCSSSLGADTAFSLMRSESVGFSLIFFIAHHATRSEGRVVII